jgi:hypothetical protein
MLRGKENRHGGEIRRFSVMGNFTKHNCAGWERTPLVSFKVMRFKLGNDNVTAIFFVSIIHTVISFSLLTLTG